METRGRNVAVLTRLRPLLAAALLLVPLRSVEAQATRALAGRWSITLWVDSAATPSATKTVTGTLVAVAVAGVVPPTYRGSYQLALSTVGLSPDAAPLLARIGRDDSVRIVLNPAVDHGHVELVGSFGPGAIEGRWNWVGHPPGTGGRFALRPVAR